MGCCETRNTLKPDLKLAEKSLDANGTESTNSKMSDFAQHWELSFSEELEEDSKVKSINAFVISAGKDQDWTVHLEKADFSVRIKQGSPFNKRLPVILSYLDFASNISANVIVKALLIPEFRLAWDTSLEKMDLLRSSSVMRLIKKYPFLNREFNIKVLVFEGSKETSIVIHSIPNPETSANPHLVRGEIFFCVYKIIEKPSSTIFMSMQQIDNKGGTSAIYSSLIASEQTQWLCSLKKACKSSSFLQCIS